MNIEKTQEAVEPKKQFILDENGMMKEILKDECRPVEYSIKYKLKNAYEVFVRVDGTENYWISNYGRCVNNLNRKNKDTFYEHKQGKCHYTVFGIEHYPVKNKRGKPTGEVAENRYRLETSPEELVTNTFLVKYKGRSKIWHKDGDESNNWYKNLLTVTSNDYKDLRAGRIMWQELNLEQEYIEYENKASYQAYKIYNSILKRCKSTEATKYIRKCYNNTVMWQGWLDEPKSFVIWYLEHYYECGDESMHVDKDLFGNDSDMYHPDYCCILPQGLNTLLANAKKHYRDGETPENVLPMGIQYNNRTGK